MLCIVEHLYRVQDIITSKIENGSIHKLKVNEKWNLL